MSGRPRDKVRSRNGQEIAIIVVAVAGAFITILAAGRHMTSSAAVAGIGLLFAIVYWRILRGLVAVVNGFRYRMARPTKTSSPNAYDLLRSKAMSVTSNDLNLELSQTEMTPYGILMETGYSNAVVTLTSFSSGDASL